MVEIISRRDGPRREDVQARRLIEQNRATIERIADQISGGGYSASKAPRQKPQAKGLIIHAGGGAATAAEPDPSIRITLNGRVICVDRNSGRQMHHIGDVRHRNGGQVFVLATRENGFFAPVEDAVGQALLDLDGARLDTDLTEEQLAAAIGEKLGIA